MSREQILAGIRSALATAAMPPEENEAREYQTQPRLTRSQKEELFTERLYEYGARVFRCEEADIPRVIQDVLLGAARHCMLAPSGLALNWLTADVEWLPDANLDYAAMETADGVLTTATAAVAESGSLALTHGAGQGRRALTLVPDYHLCVLRASQLVETLPECLARLATAQAQLITFVSGPSATADIEMTRIKGVHGPRFLDVVFVNDEL